MVMQDEIVVEWFCFICNLFDGFMEPHQVNIESKELLLNWIM